MEADERIRLAETPRSHSLTSARRRAGRMGKAARGNATRDSQSVFEPSADRARPGHAPRGPGDDRVHELVPIRYGRMLVSPFTFFRGAALIMASDLSTTPRSGLTAQLCGDAHLSNFGVFGSPERQLVFDCNDFDETHPGPWEWDVKRLAASVVVASRDLGFEERANRGRRGPGPVLPGADAADGGDEQPRGLVLPVDVSRSWWSLQASRPRLQDRRAHRGHRHQARPPRPTPRTASKRSTS